MLSDCLSAPLVEVKYFRAMVVNRCAVVEKPINYKRWNTSLLAALLSMVCEALHLFASSVFMSSN